MITASEARKLVETSESEVSNLLDKIDAGIKLAATLGQRKYVCKELPCNAIMSREKYEETPLQTIIMNCLRKLGYRVTIEAIGLPYIPRGLDSDGYDPLYQNYSFMIYW